MATDCATSAGINTWTGQPYSQQIDPDLAHLLTVQRTDSPHLDRYRLPFEQARKLLVEERRRSQTNRLPMHEVREEILIVSGRQVGLRWYCAHALEGNNTPLIYLHGGGWCVGSNDTHDTVLRHIAHASGLPVCGVEYALAPEHPFPAALEDVQGVVDSLLNHPVAHEMGARVVLAGDSAGATLALVEAMRRRDNGQPHDIAALLLFYGAYGPLRTAGSYAAYGDGRFGLSYSAQERYLDAYLQSANRNDPRAFPLLGNLSGLPPAYLLAAELDPLYDDSIDLQRALAAAGGQSHLCVAHALPHGFVNQANELPRAASLVQDAARFITSSLEAVINPVASAGA